MNISVKRGFCLTWFFIFVLSGSVSAQPVMHPHDVKLIGEMRRVMWQGELGGTIDLDTISNKQNLYGLGPVENLTGEILILHGVSYVSNVMDEHTLRVNETYGVKAPFFGYANIDKWAEVILPDSVQDMAGLQEYLDDITLMRRRPFFFRLTGRIDFARIHVVNLPKGARVSSPAEAHAGLVTYVLHDKRVEILGFFSTEHQAVFTHHDTFLHMHLITDDHKSMGHVDELTGLPGRWRLYLPAE